MVKRESHKYRPAVPDVQEASMPGASRRTVLRAIGVAGLGSGVAYGLLSANLDPESDADGATAMRNDGGTTNAKTEPMKTAAQTETATTPEPASWRLESLGHSLLSSSMGGFAEGVVREDGRYAVVGTRFASSGSFLVDLSNPRSPRKIHHLPAGDAVYSVDMAFDPRDGLYYRTIQPAGASGVELVDYGFVNGTPRSPNVLAELDAGSTHNLCVHPEALLVYTVNYSDDPGTGGVDVFDVTDPHSPSKVGEAGPSGVVHDVVYDPGRKLLHCAYMGDPLDGYVILDASNPRRPTELGRFEYGKRKSYEEVELGEEAFGYCHYADFDPRRGLAVVGDERSYGAPGGKHVFDIGWREGSPKNPIPVGFTLSPNAQPMSSDANDDGEGDQLERFDWTGHNFDIVPREEATLLASGDWGEGTVLYDITDPTNPRPLDVRTTDKRQVENPGQHLEEFGSAPMTWSAVYNEKRGFVLSSDLFSGIHTFRIKPVGKA